MPKLLSLFNIQPGEGRLVLLVLSYGILLYTVNLLTRTASYALFLAQFDAATLPYAYVGIAIFATLISTIQLKLNQRFSLAAVLLGVHGFLLLTLIGCWIGTGLSSWRWLLFSLPIYFGVLNTLTITSFWNLLGRIYNLQQGKRLFGLLSSSEHIATIATGFLSPLLVLWLGTVNLFLLGAVGIIVSMALLWTIINLNTDTMANATPEKSSDPHKASDSLFNDSYVRLIIGLFTLFIIGIYFVDNIFYSQVELRYTNEDELASFIGLFFGVFGVLSLFAQTFVVGRVLARFGVKSLILATPLGLLATMGLFTMVGTFSQWSIVLFWLIAGANMYRFILDAVDSATVNLMYQPLPPHQRTQAQTTVVGIVYPLSVGVTGMALLLLTDVLGLTPIQLAYVLLFILAAWFFTAVALGRAYARRVQQALKQRYFSRETLVRPDQTSLAMLQQSLNSPHVGVVSYALDLLEAVAPETLSTTLPVVLEHQEREVRLDALRRVERLRLVAAAPLIRDRLSAECSRPVQSASLRVLAGLGDANLFEDIYPYLDHTDSTLRQGAIVGLLRSGELEGILAAGDKLNELLKSARPFEREQAAHILGEAAISGFYRPLLRLLDDRAASVRRAALTAAGKVKHPHLWPVVIDGLASPQTRSTALAALTAGGEAVLPAVGPALQHYSDNRDVLIRLVRVIGRVGGADALTLLTAQLDTPDAEVRHEALLALSRRGYQAQGADRLRFEAGFKTEAEQATRTLIRLIEVGDVEPTALLSAALADLLNRHRDRLFLWLAGLFDTPTILAAGETLRWGNTGVSPEQRAYALEVIDLQLPTATKTLLRPWLDDLIPAERLQRLSGTAEYSQLRLTCPERLAEIIIAPDEWLSPWTKVCALHAAGQLGAVELSMAVITTLDAPQLLLRQTAAWTLARLDAVLYKQQVSLLQQDAHPQMMETLQAIQIMQTGEKPMLTPVEKVIRLKAVDFLAEAPEEMLAEAVAYLDEIEVKAGETILAKDEINSAMYLVVEGQTCLHDSRQPIGTLAENAVFGELSILNPTPASATVTAVSDVTLLRLERTALHELLEGYSQVAWSVMQRLAQRLQHLSQAQTEPANDNLSLSGGLADLLAISTTPTTPS
ncbi:MAG: cyclic nucleotide-binding domain-containing protein [Anaerolineae bacterium]|nr:cyclic nucleotide-binding domain-containing protein [Anaerolineae bacterium]